MLSFLTRQGLVKNPGKWLSSKLERLQIQTLRKWTNTRTLIEITS